MYKLHVKSYLPRRIENKIGKRGGAFAGLVKKI